VAQTPPAEEAAKLGFGRAVLPESGAARPAVTRTHTQYRRGLTTLVAEIAARAVKGNTMRRKRQTRGGC